MASWQSKKAVSILLFSLVTLLLSAGCQWIKPIEVNPNALPPITDFTVQDPGLGSRLYLNWNTPKDDRITHVRVIRYQADSCDATNPDPDFDSADLRKDLSLDTLGENPTWVDDVNVADDTTYCYVLFAKGGALYSQPGVKTMGVSTNTRSTQAVSQFTATPDESVGARAIDLSWVNPDDIDFAGVVILRKEGDYPVSANDSAAVHVCDCRKTPLPDTGLDAGGGTDLFGDFYYDAGHSDGGVSEAAAACELSAARCRDDNDVHDGVEYFYAALAYDEARIFSEAAETTATRSIIDDDGDGYREDQNDCDDTRVDVHPNAEAADCSAIDWDCDGQGWEDRYCVRTRPQSTADCVVSDESSCDPGLGCNWHFKPDFTPCHLDTSDSEVGDLSYDICSSGMCISPGTCGDASCNVPWLNFTLPDTNQRACYDNSAELMTCPAMPCDADGSPDFCGQDAQYGWDTQNASSTRFYRDLTTTNEPVVSDTVTHLVWQCCAAGQSGDDCSTGSASTKYWQNALKYCDGLDWGGYTDWRLPDVLALSSLLDNSRFAPSIDLVAFPGTPSGYFWSSSSYASNGSDAWNVSFDDGLVNGYGKNLFPHHVRCVRSRTFVSAARFVRSETVTEQVEVQDNSTGLIWQGCAAGQSGDDCSTGSSSNKTWQEALAYCEGLDWGGHSDWRLPNRHELQSIVDYRKYNPSIDLVAFPGTPSNWFWSSSSYAKHSYNAWFVKFNYGVGIYYNLKTDNGRVRCVRSGP